MAQSYQQLANPPSLMNLYLQMQQRQQAEAGFNSGLALIAANHSPPSMRQSIMQALTGNQGDAAGTVNNLMSLYQTQQQMGATQDMLSHASDYDTKLNLPPGTSRDMILAGRGSELVGQLMPTTETRDNQAKHDMFIKSAVAQGQDPQAAEQQWQSTYLPLIITGGIPGMTGDALSRTHALIRWKNDPANQGKDPPGYLTDDGKWKIYTQDLSDAKQQFGGVNDSLGKFVGDMSEVANNPSLDKITGSVGGILTGAFAGLAPGEVNNLKTQMKGLSDEFKERYKSGGPKGVNQNLKTLGSSLDDFTNGSSPTTATLSSRRACGRLSKRRPTPEEREWPMAPTFRYLQHYMDPMA